MIAFIITFALGVAQMLLLNALLKCALSGKLKKTAVFIFLKLALYGAVIAAIMLFFKQSIVPAAVGFSVGLPGAAVVFTIITLCRGKKAAALKGDDKAWTQ